MKKDDAKTEIFKIWLNWSEPQDKYQTRFGLFFYYWLQKNKPHLMSFRCTADRYQVINTWVKGWQRDRSDEY